MLSDGSQPTKEADERSLLRALEAPAGLRSLPERIGNAPAGRALPILRASRIATHGRSVMSQVRTAFAQENDRGAPFLFLPVALGVGAIVYFWLPEEPPLSAVVLGAAVLVALLWLARSRPVVRFCMAAALSVVTGILAGKVETLRVATPMLGAEVTSRLTGRVSGLSRDEKGHFRLVVDVVETDRPHLKYGPARVRAWANRVPEGLAIGDGVQGFIRLRPQSGPVRPNGYDFAFQGYFAGVGATGFFLGSPRRVEIPPPDLAERIALAGGKIRQALTARIRRQIGGEDGAVAAALITGEKAGISDDVNEALRVSGLAHLLSISGLHMALVAGTIMLVLRAVFALFPAYASRRAVKKRAAATALGMAAVYLVISGSGIATQRSFIMLVVMLLAVLADRAAITMRNLAIAALFIVAVSPHEIVGPSFQMSFAATAALIAGYAWWSRRNIASDEPRLALGWLLPRPVLAVARFLLAIATTSLIAGTATGIFAAFHFNRFAAMGIVANVLAVPVFSLAVMPLGILGVIAIPFDLDAPPLRLMGHAIGLVIRIAEEVAAISPDGGTGLMPVSALLCLSAALVVGTLSTTRLRFAALPLLAAGLLLFHRERPPDIVVSEDARLVALRMAGDVLAVNTSRPNAFSLDDWRRAYGAVYVAKPEKAKEPVAETGGFTCTDGVCAAEEDGGLDVAYARTSEAREVACRLGDIVILAYPSRKAGCPQKNRLVVTARDLALNGTLEIRLPVGETPTGGKANRLSKAVLSYALEGRIARPWQAQRVYSHAARGISTNRAQSSARNSTHRTGRPATYQ